MIYLKFNRILFLSLLLSLLFIVPCFAAEKQYNEDGYYIATDEDFEFISSNDSRRPVYNTLGRGEFRYIGTEEKVQLPDKILGEVVLDYVNIFRESTPTRLIVKLPANSTAPMWCMFSGNTTIEYLELHANEAAPVNTLASFVQGCTNLEEVYIYDLNTSQVHTYSTWFSNNPNLKVIDVSSCNVTGYIYQALNPFSLSDSIETVYVRTDDDGNRLKSWGLPMSTEVITRGVTLRKLSLDSSSKLRFNVGERFTAIFNTVTSDCTVNTINNDDVIYKITKKN